MKVNDKFLKKVERANRLPCVWGVRCLFEASDNPEGQVILSFYEQGGDRRTSEVVMSNGEALDLSLELLNLVKGHLKVLRKLNAGKVS